MSPDAAAPGYVAPASAEADLAPTYSSSGAAPPLPGGSSSSGLGGQSTVFDFKEFKVTLHAPGDGKSVWLTPRRAGESGAQLDGEVVLPAGSKVKEVVVALNGTIEYHRIDNRFPPDGDRIEADRSYYESPYDMKGLSWNFHKDRSVISKATVAPAEPLPFSVALPATYPSEVQPGRDLPPSCQVEDHGVRYYLKITLSTGGMFKKRVEKFIPVQYAPLHTVDFMHPARIAARSSGGPASVPAPGEDKDSWQKTTKEIPGGYYASVFTAAPAQYVRGEELDFFLRLDCPLGQGGKGWPVEQIVAELRVSQEWTHLDDDVLERATLTPVDSTLLPPLPSDLNETHAPACYRGVVPIAGTVCPSFKVRQLQQTHSLRVSFHAAPRAEGAAGKTKEKLKTKPTPPVALVKVPVTILNLEGAGGPYVVGGKYLNPDALGAMVMQGKDPIERM